MVCICIVICYFKLHFCKYFSDHTGRQDASVLSERNSATVCARTIRLVLGHSDENNACQNSFSRGLASPVYIQITT